MKLKGTLVFLVVAGCVMATGALSSAGAARTSLNTSAISYTGNAYGAGITSTRRYWKGLIAVTGVACNAKAGYQSLSDTYALRVSRLITAGPVTATARTSAGKGVAQSVTTSRVSNVSVLSGLIKIRNLTAKSSTKLHDSHFALSTAGSGINKLIVKGVSVKWSPKTIRVPRVGTILLDQRVKLTSSSGARMSIIIFELVFAKNKLGVPAGTTLVLGDATSGLERGASASGVSGFSYGTLRTGSSLLSQSSPPVQMGMCSGTDGVVHSDSVPTWNIPGVLTTGPIVVDADGASGGQLIGESSSNVQSLDLYRGFITAKVVHAEASIITSRGLVATLRGSHFDDLKIDGHRITGTIRSNTHLTFGNIGVYLRRTASTAASAAITMLEVVAIGPNKFRLTPGHTVRVGYASISALPQ